MLKKGLLNGQLSPWGPCWENWRSSFTGTFERKREKENVYFGSFSWTQRTLKIKSGGHLEL